MNEKKNIIGLRHHINLKRNLKPIADRKSQTYGRKKMPLNKKKTKPNKIRTLHARIISEKQNQKNKPETNNEKNI